MGPEQQIQRIAATQHWVIHRDQVLRCEVSPRAISRRLQSKAWRKVFPKVYFVVGGKVDGKARLMAASLWGGEEAVASGLAAAWLYGLTSSVPATIDVIVPRKRVSPPGIRLHLDRRLARSDRATFDSIPVPRVERLLFDLCGSLAISAAGRMIDEALRSERTDLLRLAKALDRHGKSGRKGTAVFRKLLLRRVTIGVTDSDGEDLFARMAERRGLTLVHHFVVADSGFYAELDFAALPEKIDIEIDGRDHDNPVQQDRDKARDVELGCRGWVVLRFTYRDLIERPDWVFESILNVLAVRRAS